MRITVGRLRRLVREATSARAETPSSLPPGLKAAAGRLFAALELDPWAERTVPRAAAVVAAALEAPGVARPDPGVLDYLDDTGIFDGGPDGEPVTLRWLVGELMWAATMTARDTGGSPAAGLAAAEAWLLSAAEVAQGEDAPSDPSEPFGRYAFPRQRVKGRMPPIERDTAAEKAAFAALQSHFANNEPLPRDVVATFRDIIAAGKYTDVIRQPSAASKVHRGSGASPQWLRRVLGLSPSDPLPPRGTAEVSYTYTSSGGEATSWSTSKRVATSFMDEAAANAESRGTPHFAVIMTASVAANPGVFMAGRSGLYNLNVGADFEAEEECLALGPVAIKSVSWVGNTAAGGGAAGKKR